MEKAIDAMFYLPLDGEGKVGVILDFFQHPHIDLPPSETVSQ